MASLTIDYPPDVQFALDEAPDAFEREARELLAVKLYETGRLSTGLAAKLAGLPRVAFLYLLSRRGLSAFGETPEGLERDLDHARRAGGSQ
jgi:predicted HTH domain antitoxin